MLPSGDRLQEIPNEWIRRSQQETADSLATLNLFIYFSASRFQFIYFTVACHCRGWLEVRNSEMYFHIPLLSNLDAFGHFHLLS